MGTTPRQQHGLKISFPCSFVSSILSDRNRFSTKVLSVQLIQGPTLRRPIPSPRRPEKRPKKEEYLQDCPENMVDPFCRKIYQNVRGDERVIRSCATVRDERTDRECYTTVLEEYNTEVCQCFDEACNSGNMFKVSSLAVLSAVLLAYLIH